MKTHTEDELPSAYESWSTILRCAAWPNRHETKDNSRLQSTYPALDTPLLNLSQLYTFVCSCYGNRINNRPVWCLWFQLGASHIEPSDSSHAGDGAVFQRRVEEGWKMEAERKTLGAIAVCCTQPNRFIAICMASSYWPLNVSDLLFFNVIDPLPSVSNSVYQTIFNKTPSPCSVAQPHLSRTLRAQGSGRKWQLRWNYANYNNSFLRGGPNEDVTALLIMSQLCQKQPSPWQRQKRRLRIKLNQSWQDSGSCSKVWCIGQWFSVGAARCDTVNPSLTLNPTPSLTLILTNSPNQKSSNLNPSPKRNTNTVKPKS